MRDLQAHLIFKDPSGMLLLWENCMTFTCSLLLTESILPAGEAHMVCFRCILREVARPKVQSLFPFFCPSEHAVFPDTAKHHLLSASSSSNFYLCINFLKAFYHFCDIILIMMHILSLKA